MQTLSNHATNFDGAFLLVGFHCIALVSQLLFRIVVNKISIYLSIYLSISVIPKLWPAGHFWPAASYKMARQDLWSSIFYLYHISV